MSTEAAEPTTGGTLARRPASLGIDRHAARWAAWAAVVAVLGLWVSTGGPADLVNPASRPYSLGQLAGLLAGLALVLDMILVARIPHLERAFGHGELLRAHRWLGPTVFALLAAHVVLAFPADGPRQAMSALTVLITSWDLAFAAAATAAVLAVAATSLWPLRPLLRRYELWHKIHLAAYASLALSLPHEVTRGQAVTSSPWAMSAWVAATALVYWAVLKFRILPPLRSLRYEIRVDKVIPAGLDTVTFIMSGHARDIAGLGFEAGQFAVWRFLDGPGWSRGHPFSISYAPLLNELRITVKDNDGTHRWRNMPLGTRVLVEGPYGRFTPAARTRDRVAFAVTDGGAAPAHSVLQDMCRRSAATGATVDAVVLYRFSESQDEPALLEQLQQLEDYGVTVVPLPGKRAGSKQSPSWLPEGHRALKEPNPLAALVPDLCVDRDLYICGPPAWMALVRGAASHAGVKDDQIHQERFGW